MNECMQCRKRHPTDAEELKRERAAFVAARYVRPAHPHAPLPAPAPSAEAQLPAPAAALQHNDAQHAQLVPRSRRAQLFGEGRC